MASHRFADPRAINVRNFIFQATCLMRPISAAWVSLFFLVISRDQTTRRPNEPSPGGTSSLVEEIKTPIGCALGGLWRLSCSISCSCYSMYARPDLTDVASWLLLPTHVILYFISCCVIAGHRHGFTVPCSAVQCSTGLYR